MNFVLQPRQLLLTILAGLVNRQQQEVIECRRTEHQVLKQAQGNRRIRLKLTGDSNAPDCIACSPT